MIIIIASLVKKSHPTPSSSHRHPTTTYNYDDNVVVVGVVYSSSIHSHRVLPCACPERIMIVAHLSLGLSQEMTAFSFHIFVTSF